MTDPYRQSAPAGFKTARRMRATRHRMVVSQDVVARVVSRVEVDADEDTEALIAPLVAERTERREALQRLHARRKRMAALVRRTRDPQRHGALRQALLRLDATIIALERSLPPAA